MSFISLVKSSTLYTGTISVADGFSGNKDVTLSPTVDPTRVMQLIPLKVTANLGVAPVSFAHSSSGSMGFGSVQVAAANIFRFVGVTNSVGGGTQTLTYAFQVVEAR